MPAIRPLRDDEVNDQLKIIFEKSEKGTGSNNMLRTLAHNPEIMDSFLSFYSTLWKGSVDPKLKEMLRYRIALKGECSYWGSVRTAWVKRNGLTEEILQKVDDYQNSDLGELNINALKLADKMVDNDEMDKLEIFENLKKYLSEKELIELIMCISIFMGVGRMNKFIGLDYWNLYKDVPF